MTLEEIQTAQKQIDKVLNKIYEIEMELSGIKAVIADIQLKLNNADIENDNV